MSISDTGGNDDPLVYCKRCKEQKPGVQNVPWGGALGDEIRANTCEETWREWLNMEVMVINELRLNFMDPKSQDVLIGHMREFLCLDADEGTNEVADKTAEKTTEPPPEP